MELDINFDATNLIQSESQSAPFRVIYQSDDDGGVWYAIQFDADELRISDQIETGNAPDIIDPAILWNASGDRAACVVNQRIEGIFDFSNRVTYTSQINPTVPTTWARKTLAFSTELAEEFGIGKLFKQPHIDHAIDELNGNDTQTNRLLFYKALLTSSFFVPITTKDPSDPKALMYTFPYESEGKGNVIVATTNPKVFHQQMGQYGLSYRKISADYLCFQAQSFDDILGISITSESGHTVLITRNEFQLLAMISQPQRLDTQALLKEMGLVFFDDLFDSNRSQVEAFYQAEFANHALVRSGFYCQPSVNGAKPLFCLVVKSTEASDALTQLVQALKSSDIHSFCDAHVFSLSDIVAQSLAASKQAL